MQNCEENQNAQILNIKTQIKGNSVANMLNGQRISENNSGYANLSGEQLSITEASPCTIEKTNLKQQQQKVNGYQNGPQYEELTIADMVLKDLQVKFLGFSIAQALILLCLAVYQLPYLLQGDEIYFSAGIIYIQSIIFFYLSYLVGLYSRIKQLPKLQFAFQILIVLAFIFEAIGNLIIFYLFLQGSESRDNLKGLFGVAAFSIFFFWISSGFLSNNSRKIMKVMSIVIKEKDQKLSKRNQTLKRILESNQHY